MTRGPTFDEAVAEWRRRIKADQALAAEAVVEYALDGGSGETLAEHIATLGRAGRAHEANLQALFDQAVDVMAEAVVEVRRLGWMPLLEE